MKVKYLGTAAAEGWPGIFCQCHSCKKALQLGGKNIRTRSQMIIDNVLLMDFSPDTYMHVLQHNLDLLAVKDNLITHSHTDHFYSDGYILRASPYAHNGHKNKLKVYGNKKVGTLFQRTLDTEDDSDNMRDCVEFKEITGFTPFSLENYLVTPLPAYHDPTEDCFIYIIEDMAGKRILYGNDTGYFPEETWEYIKNISFDLVSLDCTLGDITSGPSAHMTLSENAEVIKRMADLGCIHQKTRCISTHFSHNGNLMHEEMVERGRPLGLEIAYDGLKIEL